VENDYGAIVYGNRPFLWLAYLNFKRPMSALAEVGRSYVDKSIR
jgi:hypothetical protein